MIASQYEEVLPQTYHAALNHESKSRRNSFSSDSSNASSSLTNISSISSISKSNDSQHRRDGGKLRPRARRPCLRAGVVVAFVALALLLALWIGHQHGFTSIAIKQLSESYTTYVCHSVKMPPPPPVADSLLQATDCSAPKPNAHSLGVPRIYVAWNEVRPLWEGAECGMDREYHFVQWLLTNMTGTLVSRPEASEWVLIPFPGTCKYNLSKGLPKFDDFRAAVHQAVDHRLQHKNFFVYCHTPWMDRTHFDMESRTFLRRYPEITLLSPEIKNLRWDELKRYPELFHRHIVMPHYETDFRVLRAPKAENWPRPYKFCFQGTILNVGRQNLFDVLSSRNDSYVQSSCRQERNAFVQVISTDNSASLYTQCQFCPLGMGDSLADQRFMDVVRAGCIPVSIVDLRPMPFAAWLPYEGFALSAIYWDKPSLTKVFNRLATMSPEEIRKRQVVMAEVAQQVTFADCNGHRHGLYYALASLQLPGEVRNIDLQGFLQPSVRITV